MIKDEGKIVENINREEKIDMIESVGEEHLTTKIIESTRMRKSFCYLLFFYQKEKERFI